MLLVAIKLSVVVLTFGIGLGSTPADLAYLWRRPGLLVRSLVAMYVAVPVAAMLMAKMLPLSLPVKTAVVVLAISAGAPLLPRKLQKLGREGYVFSLVVTASLLAIVVVPLWLTAISRLVGREMSVNPWTLARLITKALLAPLVLGMLLRWPLSRVADRLSDWILGLGDVLLAASGLGLLVVHGRLLVAAGWVPLLTLAGMTLLSLAIGHVLGGPDPEDRTALAVSCATRHVGIAMLAASTAPGPRAMTLVLAYLLATTAVSIPYLRWRRRATSSSAVVSMQP
jgi:BASS family bile acid:Na+ symporter